MYGSPGYARRSTSTGIATLAMSSNATRRPYRLPSFMRTEVALTASLVNVTPSPTSVTMYVTSTVRSTRRAIRRANEMEPSR